MNVFTSKTTLLILLVLFTHNGSFSIENFEFENDYRLSKSIIPRKYFINYDEIDFIADTFKGSVEIHADVNEKTNKISLHKGKYLNITDVKINSSIKQKEVKINDKAETYTILLDSELKKSIPFVFTLNFKGKLRDDMIGFYKSSYKESNKERYLAATQFESTHARHAFPCFDEPALKANFLVTIKPPGDNYICLSNMPQIYTRKKICKFEQSVEMSTYLVAFIVADFEAVKDEKFAVWSRRDAVDQSKYALTIGQASQDYFSKHLNISYSLSKMDMVAVPDFSAGAMENWGLITYRETAVLYDENHSSNAAMQRVASVIVHEMAHQWFGNLVTPEWWNYLWLSEGFARYYEYMGTHALQPMWEMDKQFVVQQHQTALAVDSLVDSSPLTRRNITTQEQIGTTGGSITYNKGASIIRMMRHTFGSNIFDDALRIYLNERKYANASPDDLWEAIEKSLIKHKAQKLPVNVSSIMKTWTEQSGFPYISVVIKQDTITLEQNRFLLQDQNEVSDDFKWWVPITVASSCWNNVTEMQSTKPVFWLSEKKNSVKNTFGNEWIIFNVQSVGYYRVLYDEASWKKILSVLNSKDFEKISVENRAAIIDDLMNFARVKKVSYDLVFEGLKYLKRETSYLPFKAAFNGIDYLSKKLINDSRIGEFFRNHVQALLSKAYKNLTFNDKPDDKQSTILLRQEINSRLCNLGHSDCILDSLNHFYSWKNSKQGKYSIPKNQRGVVYCTAMKYGNEEDWEFLRLAYDNSNVAAEQIVILNALGCTKDKKLLEKHFLNALSGFSNSGIRKQDISYVFSGAHSSSPENAEYILDFVKNHITELHKYYKNYEDIVSLINGAVKSYQTENIHRKLKEMIENPGELKDNVKSLNKSLKIVEDERKWLERAYEDISKLVAPENYNVLYRLPKNILPIHYNIELTPFIKDPKDFTFNGKIEIIANVTKSTEKIVLHVNQLRDLNFKIYEEGNKEILIKSLVPDDTHDFVKIYLKYPVRNGTILKIDATFVGYLNTEMRGFYRSSYKISGKTRWLAATHLEPTGARRVFPCFDEPALKATFNISVMVPDSTYTAVSNMNRISKRGNLWVFEKTPPMSTYLVAIVVSDFQKKSADEQSSPTLSAYANPNVYKQLEYALQVMRPIVKSFEKKLNFTYTLPKLDMFALPDFSSGAMENWGLMTFRETNLLYDGEKMSSITAKQSIHNVIVHEITHQWFGNLVSPLWWDYVWLSEGFARYFQNHMYYKDAENWNLEGQFVVDHLQTSFSTDGTNGTHPVSAKVYTPSEIKGIFDKISYAKAASLIRMLEKLTGPTAFYGALQEYLKNRQYSFGTPTALFIPFQKQIGSGKSLTKFDVIEVMNSWTKQSGFPVVHASFKNGSMILTQKRFYTRPPNNSNSKSIWNIPITYTTRTVADFSDLRDVFWLKDKTATLEVRNANINDWIILNLQQAGYYRVNYDEAMWRLIISDLHSESRERIHPINRANLIDDLFNLARAGEIGYDIILSATDYLVNETDYVPWKAALTNLNYLTKRFVGRGFVEQAYKDYVINLLEPSFKRLGFFDKKDDKHTDILLRKVVLETLCAFGYEKCINEAKKLFEEERKQVIPIVPPNQQLFVYSAIARYSDERNWNYLYKKFTDSIYATEKSTLITVLACSSKPDLLNKLMELAITPDSEIRLQDVQKVFNNVIDGGPVGVNAALDFINKSYEDMYRYLGDYSVAKSTISTISKRLSTQELVDKFKKFTKDNLKRMESIKKTLQSSENRAKFELDWFKENAMKIAMSIDTKLFTRNPYRLPAIAIPKHYDISLKPDFETFTFNGSVKINITVQEDTYTITLNAADMDNIQVYYNEVKVAHKYDSTNQYLRIYFAEELRAKKLIQLNISYKGNLRDDMKGFYRSYYINEKGEKKWLLSTQFEPSYARRAFPCFDEPSFKATFKIRISRPNNLSTLSNMGSNPKTTPDVEGRSWDEYETTVNQMSTYLVAFVISDFVKTTDVQSRVNIWSRNQLKDYVKDSVRIGHNALTYLEKFLQINYTFPEMNFVAVPDFDMGAMENWGLVTYREYGLTYDLSKISATYKRYVETTVAHELVHMWFGNLVTCDWWDYTWLNEAFAEYLSYVTSDANQPTWKLMKQFVVNNLHSALAADASGTSHPMNNKVLTPRELQDGFDSIAYAKGSSILRMIDHSFGPKVFRLALRLYLEKHKYKNVHPQDLYNVIENKIAAEKIKIPGGLKVNSSTVIDSWTSQSGYPVVNTKRYGSTIEISQERFYISQPENGIKNKTLYWIPITYMSESNANFSHTLPYTWLHGTTENLYVFPTDKWYVLNVQQVGFYRVNYDGANWRALIRVLNSPNYQQIEEVSRAQLIDDSFNLARAGYIKYEIALDISKYLSQETMFYPLKAMNSVSDYLGRRIEAREDVKKLYSKHIFNILDKTYKKLGFEENMSKDSHLDQLTREIVLKLACKYGHEDCIKNAKSYFSSDFSRITPNIAGAVYCTAIEHGSDSDWNILWQKFKAANLATDYLTILRGLGCSREESVLTRYLDYAIEKDSPIRRQDIGTTFSSIYSSSQIGMQTTLKYILQNPEKLKKYYGDWEDVSGLIKNVAGYITTTKQLDMLKNANTNINSEFEDAVKSAIKSAEKNLKWFDDNVNDIYDWLKTNYDSITLKSL
ncbi:hypothetical protein TKK_0017359 [Trichogramma kaykai]|uniref:Aminopeptidase N n=1 Tax=Trichogramma kaykai TaxID=54128 RepID=A0ABD2W450_9HYME